MLAPKAMSAVSSGSSNKFPVQKFLVKKFGGTSVGSIERIENLAERLKREMQNGEIPVVVVSAMSGETNRLIALGESIDPDYRGPAYDMLIASGEQVSVSLLAMALNKRGLKAQPLLAFQIGLQTDSVHAKARIQKIDSARLKNYIHQGIIPVVAGFQGISATDELTTLGRGGSDTTAVAIAAALGARECEIFTDVPAVYTADPRLVPKAKEMAMIAFEEMMEMASLGSKVLHIRSVEIAAKSSVRIHVRSTFETRQGTWIVPEGEIVEEALVSSITHESSTAIFKLFPVPKGPRFLADLFSLLAQRGVVVDIITQSEHIEGQRLAFSTSKEDVPLARKVLAEILPKETDLQIIEEQAKISVVGVGMRNHPGVAADFFAVLAEQNIPVHLVTTSEIKISAVIGSEHLKTAAIALHHAFGLDAGA